MKKAYPDYPIFSKDTSCRVLSGNPFLGLALSENRLKLSMKILIFSLMFLLLACDQGGGKKSNSRKLPGLPETVILGETSRNDVDRELGEPTSSYEVKDAVINTYEDGKALKIQNDVVKSYFREPKENEVHLQYWLQLWKDKAPKSSEIESSKNAHGKYEYQLISEEDHTTVVYDKESGLVKRVIHYEK